MVWGSTTESVVVWVEWCVVGKMETTVREYTKQTKRWESLIKLNSSSLYKPFSCVPNLVQISEFFNDILEKPGKMEWNCEILKFKGTLLYLVKYSCLWNLQCKSEYYIDFAIRNKISPIKVSNWKTKRTPTKNTPLGLLEITSCLSSVLSVSQPIP